MTSFRALVHASVSILAIFAACPAFAQEATPGSVCSTAGAFVRSGGPELSGEGHFMVCSGGTWASALSYSSTGNTLVPAGFSLTGDISPASIGAGQNDYAPTGHASASVMRLTASGAYNITGLQGGLDGRVVTLTNIGSSAITLTNDDVASTAANRFLIGGNVALAANDSLTLIYDSTSQRWRPHGATPSAGGGIESVGGLSAPSAGPFCTRRTATTSTAATTISCIAGEVMTGGGCGHSSTTYSIEDSYPSAAATWSCEWSGAAATGTAYAVCCVY